jgi:hypothetical protein
VQALPWTHAYPPRPAVHGENRAKARLSPHWEKAIAATTDAVFFVERVEKPTDNRPAWCFATATDAGSCLSCGKGDQSTIGPGARPFRAGADDDFDRYDWLGRS